MFVVSYLSRFFGIHIFYSLISLSKAYTLGKYKLLLLNTWTCEISPNSDDILRLLTLRKFQLTIFLANFKWPSQSAKRD